MPVELNGGLRVAVVAWALLATGFAAAQGMPAAVPETRQMIDALKPGANRSMRNLLVRPAAAEPEAPAAAGAPVGATTSVMAPAAAPTAAPSSVPPPPPSATAAGPAEPAPSLSLAIQFDLNSARVRPESGAVLGNLVAALLSPDLKGNRFVIEGHTDARGVPAANLRLSQQRADEVRLYLVALGVHPARLKAVGKGSSEPANRADPLSADNRRVRVVTLE